MHFTRRRDVVVLDKSDENHAGQLIVPRDELRGGMIIYLHGGGYVCGTSEYAKGFASVLSAECGMKVLSVEYRLAPEHPYPAALEDAYLAYCEVLARGLGPEKIIIAGESAGGASSATLRTIRLNVSAFAKVPPCYPVVV
jgi:acetyl esterase/lipase